MRSYPFFAFYVYKRFIITFCRSASHLKRVRRYTSLGKSAATSEFDVAMHKSRDPVAEGIFRVLRTWTRKRAREDSPIFPGGNRQVSPGWRAPPKYCLLGELCLSRLSVCPIHFTSSVPHSPFALARCFSSDWSWLIAFVRTETQMLSQ